MPNKQVHRVKTISELHKLRGLPQPEHPLISIMDYAAVQRSAEHNNVSWVFDFYSISLKRDVAFKMKYGQQDCDFDEGVMFFIAPGQVFSVEVEHTKYSERSGWILLIHPDFIWNTPLARKMKQYEFFDYSVHEALFVSDKEEVAITGIVRQMEQEYQANIDNFSQNIIIAQIELLLSYAERFYHRQFITRKVINHHVLDKLDTLLNNYFDSDAIMKQGLPGVAYIAQQLNVSPGYLGSLLKVLTGLNAQQHIHQKLIEKAKEKLSATELSVSEIAYELGFEHPQSFSKLFKAKTNQSPLEFRQSFN